MKKTMTLALRWLSLITLASAMGAWAAFGPGASTVVSSGKFRKVAQPIPSQYIVTLRPEGIAAYGDLSALAAALARQYGGEIFQEYRHALKGFALRLSAAAAEVLSMEPAVDWVEEDGIVQADGTQMSPPWGLDRIDQRNLPLDSIYNYPVNGTGTHVYVIDTGIRTTHLEFGGRASGVYTAINDGWGTNDCNGHGTHVSGSIGGATYGVAKAASLHAVRVLGCDGTGATSGVIAGVDWVTANHLNPAVANMSLGGPGNTSLDTSVQNSISSGVTYVVAAGNSTADACLYSPSRVGPALTVGASDSADLVAGFSNQGSCVDLFAPGVGVLSAYNTSDTAMATLQGTSMAAPHVAGVAAMYLAANPSATPASVANAIIAQGTANVLSSLTAGSPNLLLFSNFVTCQTGLTNCSDQCVNLSSDKNNCGSCGFACAGAAEGCFGGVCRCPTGTISCCGGDICSSTRCPICP